METPIGETNHGAFFVVDDDVRHARHVERVESGLGGGQRTIVGVVTRNVHLQLIPRSRRWGEKRVGGEKRVRVVVGERGGGVGGEKGGGG